MSALQPGQHWRIDRAYGHGAAQIRISAPAWSAPLDSTWLDPDEAGASTAKRLLATLPAALLALLLAGAFFSTVFRSYEDQSEIELVAFADPLPPPLEPIVEPEAPKPPAQIAKVEPPKPPVAKPKPAKPKPIARPKPVAPPQIAKAAPPRPKPVAKAPRPKPKARPKIQMDRIAAQAPPKPVAAPTRASRRAPDRAEAQRKLAVAGLSAPAPSADAAAPTARRQRVAASKPRPNARPGVSVAALPSSPRPEMPDNAPTQRAARTRPEAQRRGTPRPALSAAAAPAPNAEFQNPGRAQRSAAARPESQNTRRQPGLAFEGAPSTATAGSASAGARRSAERVTAARPAASGGSRGGTGNDLVGVPLGSLAACASDSDEDRLKQRVVVAVTKSRAQGECLSPAGRYRFVQTKNLNAFLMYVEQAPGRASADRCTELAHALSCLERMRRR